MSSQPIQCRAAVIWKRGDLTVIEEVTVAPPGVGEVRIRMVAAGVCGTDSHMVFKDVEMEMPSGPVILGHEGAGVVESVGEDVQSVAVGDHVLTLWMPQCDQCPLCTAIPATNLCASGNIHTLWLLADGKSRIECKGQPIARQAGVGAFCEYLVLSEGQVAKVDAAAPLDKICTIGCAVGTGYGTAVKAAQVFKGASVAIWGLGAVGLSAALGAKDSGANKIIGVGSNPDKLELGKMFGITDFVNHREVASVSDTLKEMCPPLGVDFALDCIGSPESVEAALSSLTPWGTYVLAGIPAKTTTKDLPIGQLITGQRLTGALFGGYKSRNGVQELVAKYVAGQLPIDSLVTNRFKLDEITQALQLVKEWKAIKSIVLF